MKPRIEVTDEQENVLQVDGSVTNNQVFYNWYLGYYSTDMSFGKPFAIFMPFYFDAENVPETSAADSEIRGL